ncbi:hypothetical protein [Rheinheimera mesophila]|nr:hypothetical protein [Rheinheimera mesophila]
MNSIHTTVEKSDLSTTERSVSSLLLVRRINQFLAQIGRALSLSGAVYTK